MKAISKQQNVWFWSFAFVTILCIAIAFIFQNYFLIAVPFAIIFCLVFSFNIKFLYFLLIAVIPISINLLEFGIVSLDFPDEPLLLCLTAIFPFLFILNKDVFFNKLFFKNSLIGIIIVWLIWIIVCSITSTHPELSIKYVLVKIWFILPYVGITSLIVYQDIKNIKRIFLCYIIPLVIMVLFVTYRHSLLNFSFEDVTHACAPYFTNHVIYGSVVSLFAPLSIGAMVYCKRFSVKWYLSVLSFIIFMIAVYLAYSRGAWAAVFFALFLVVAIKKKFVQYFFILFYLSIASAAIFLNHNNKYLDFAPRFETGIMHDNLVDHLIATLKGKDISSNERFYRWVAGARMSSKNPVFGVGPNTFYENYKPYTVSIFRTYVSKNKERSTMHNYFLFMLVEQGYVGMFIYATLIFLIFYKGQKLYHQLLDKKLKIIVLSLLCMIGAFFINNTLSELVENDKLGSCFFIGIGILVALQLRVNQNANISIEN